MAYGGKIKEREEKKRKFHKKRGKGKMPKIFVGYMLLYCLPCDHRSEWAKRDFNTLIQGYILFKILW